MDKLTPPLDAMEDWEVALWEGHVGTWTSHYTVRDAAGTLLTLTEAQAAAHHSAVIVDAHAHERRSGGWRRRGGSTDERGGRWRRGGRCGSRSAISRVAGCALWRHGR